MAAIKEEPGFLEGQWDLIGDYWKKKYEGLTAPEPAPEYRAGEETPFGMALDLDEYVARDAEGNPIYTGEPSDLVNMSPTEAQTILETVGPEEKARLMNAILAKGGPLPITQLSTGQTTPAKQHILEMKRGEPITPPTSTIGQGTPPDPRMPLPRLRPGLPAEAPSQERLGGVTSTLRKDPGRGIQWDPRGTGQLVTFEPQRERERLAAEKRAAKAYFPEPVAPTVEEPLLEKIPEGPETQELIREGDAEVAAEELGLNPLQPPSDEVTPLTEDELLSYASTATEDGGRTWVGGTAGLRITGDRSVAGGSYDETNDEGVSYQGAAQAKTREGKLLVGAMGVLNKKFQETFAEELQARTMFRTAKETMLLYPPSKYPKLWKDGANTKELRWENLTAKGQQKMRASAHVTERAIDVELYGKGPNSKEYQFMIEHAHEAGMCLGNSKGEIIDDPVRGKEWWHWHYNPDCAKKQAAKWRADPSSIPGQSQRAATQKLLAEKKGKDTAEAAVREAGVSPKAGVSPGTPETVPQYPNTFLSVGSAEDVLKKTNAQSAALAKSHGLASGYEWAEREYKQNAIDLDEAADEEERLILELEEKRNAFDRDVINPMRETHLENREKAREADARAEEEYITTLGINRQQAGEEATKLNKLLDKSAADLEKRQVDPWRMYGFTDDKGDFSGSKTFFTLIGIPAMVVNLAATLATSGRKGRSAIPFIIGSMIENSINRDVSAQLEAIKNKKSAINLRYTAAGAFQQHLKDDLSLALKVREGILTKTINELARQKAEIKDAEAKFEVDQLETNLSLRLEQVKKKLHEATTTRLETATKHGIDLAKNVADIEKGITKNQIGALGQIAVIKAKKDLADGKSIIPKSMEKVYFAAKGFKEDNLPMIKKLWKAHGKDGVFQGLVKLIANVDVEEHATFQSVLDLFPNKTGMFAQYRGLRMLFRYKKMAASALSKISYNVGNDNQREQLNAMLNIPVGVNYEDGNALIAKIEAAVNALTSREFYSMPGVREVVEHNATLPIDANGKKVGAKRNPVLDVLLQTLKGAPVREHARIINSFVGRTKITGATEETEIKK